MKKLLEEFKQFIARGNVLDMAVGVVVASAFTAIVNAVVSGLLTPIIGLLLPDTTFAEWAPGGFAIGEGGKRRVEPEEKAGGKTGGSYHENLPVLPDG